MSAARCRTVLPALLLAALSSGPAFGAAPAGGDAATLLALSNQWMQGITDKDRATLERFLAPEFTLRGAGDPPERMVPRAEWIANAVNKDWSDFRFEHVVVRVDGDHAVVNSLLHFRIEPIPFPVDAGVVDTWVRRDGRWQVSGRYIGESRFAARVEFAKGVLATLALLGAFALVRWLRRRAAARRASA